jgi:hypothetical protein
MRYGLLPVTRRVWALKGVGAVVAVQPRYQWGYLIGALQVGAGGTHFCYGPTATLEMSQAFLQQLSAREPAAIHVAPSGALAHPAGQSMAATLTNAPLGSQALSRRRQD